MSRHDRSRVRRAEEQVELGSCVAGAGGRSGQPLSEFGSASPLVPPACSPRFAALHKEAHAARA